MSECNFFFVWGGGGAGLSGGNMLDSMIRRRWRKMRVGCDSGKGEYLFS